MVTRAHVVPARNRIRGNKQVDNRSKEGRLSYPLFRHSDVPNKIRILCALFERRKRFCHALILPDHVIHVHVCRLFTALAIPVSVRVGPNHFIAYDLGKASYFLCSLCEKGGYIRASQLLGLFPQIRRCIRGFGII